MSEHTIRYDYEPGYCGELVRADGVVVATFNDDPDSDDARRLVACWNACAGLTLEQIEERARGVDGPAADQMLGDLLARIHRDAGHYVMEHGWAKAVQDAEAKVVAWLTRDDAAGVAVGAGGLPDFKGYSPDGPVGMALEWLKSALTCPRFQWDGDQREYAEKSLKDAERWLADLMAASGVLGTLKEDGNG